MSFESYEQEMTNTKFDMNFDPTMEAGMNNNTNMNMKGGCGCAPTMGGCMMPIYECPRENVCHRYICYEVPHIEPCNTRIINHHIYKHTYRPEYTCSEENVVENIYENRNCC